MKKNVLITGAGGHLGKAAVEKFVLEGYNVIAIVLPGVPHTLPKEKDVDIVEADLSDSRQAQDTFAKIVATHKTIDAALLLAGAYMPGEMGKVTSNSLHKMFSLNFETAFYISQALFNQMLTQPAGGRLIFIGARTALEPAEAKQSVAYAFSKSLIFKLVEIYNATGLTKNVTSAVIAPRVIDTPPNREAMPNANFSDWVRPEEIAELMSYLCSEKGACIKEAMIKV